MNFKLWLESEYTRDTLSKDMDYDHPDILDRVKAGSAFLGGFGLDPDERKNIKIINLPKSKRIVVSAYREPPIATPIKNLDVQENRYHGGKPIGGLWYAFGNDWISFAHSDMPRKLHMFIHEVTVNTQNIIIINSEEDRRNFEIKYGWTGDSDKQSGGTLSKYKGEMDPQSLWINWKDVQKDYGGFEIHEDALDNNNWNWGWDIPSGCIWNKNALKDSKLLYVYNVKTKTYVKPTELGLYAGKASRIKNPIN